MPNKKEGRTQCERVHDYMLRFGSITPLQAMSDIGCHRLSARIKDLKECGVKIKSERVSRINRYRETIYIAKYSIEKTQTQTEMF